MWKTPEVQLQSQLALKLWAELWTLSGSRLMKEAHWTLKSITPSIEKLPLLKTKEVELKFWSLVSRSLICWLLMPEVEKLDCSEEQVSGKLCWSKSWLTTLQRPTVDTQCSQEWEKEPVRETISTTKWLNRELLRSMDQGQDVLWSTDKWTNPQVLGPELDSRDSLWLSISEMRKGRMCCFSSIISSDSPRPVLKCPHCSDVSLQPWGISPPWQQIWEPCKKELLQPKKDPSPPCKPFTSQPMTWPTPPLQPPSPIWTQPLCWIEPWQNSEFTLQSILWTPPAECSTPTWLGKNTTSVQEEFRNCCRTTNLCRISLPFSEWTSFPKKTDWQWQEQEKCRSSWVNLSSWARCSREEKASSWVCKTPSQGSTLC